MSKVSASVRVPSYRHHKPTGQAVVTLNGKDYYLGSHRSKRSKTEYERLIAEWLAGGRRLPDSEVGVTVAELALGYWNHAKRY